MHWRTSDKPPGRFLTRTNPELGDETLWHDVGHDVAMKKAAKILSEKMPPSGQNGEGSGRKRKSVSCIPDQTPPKQLNTGTGSQQASVAASTAAVAVSGTGVARLPRSSQVHKAPQLQDLTQVATFRPQAPALSQQQLLQFAFDCASPNAILRNATAQNSSAFGIRTPNEYSGLLAASLLPSDMADVPILTRLRIIQALQGSKHATHGAGGAGGAGVFMGSLSNVATAATSLANIQAMEQANNQALAQAALLRASNSSARTSAAAAAGGVDLSATSKAALLAEFLNSATPAASQALLQAALSGNSSLAADRMALLTQNNNDVSGGSLMTSNSFTSGLLAELHARATAVSNREQNDVQDLLRLATSSSVLTHGLRAAPTQNQFTDVNARKAETALLARSIQALRASSHQQGKTTENGKTA